MKLNKKGFTLVELIVVMAIIAVLAAILVPTMLGFMNNAKFTQANANAKTVYTAVNSVVADHCTDNAALTGGATALLESTALDSFEIDSQTFKMKAFLEGMTGNASVKLNASGTGVEYTTWSLGAITAAQAQVIKADQKAGVPGEGASSTAYQGSDIVGGYPLA